jgi:hypothetical protein
MGASHCPGLAAAIIIIIIIMLPNQAIASTPSAPRPSGLAAASSLTLSLLGTCHFLIHSAACKNILPVPLA